MRNVGNRAKGQERDRGTLQRTEVKPSTAQQPRQSKIVSAVREGESELYAGRKHLFWRVKPNMFLDPNWESLPELDPH